MQRSLTYIQKPFVLKATGKTYKQIILFILFQLSRSSLLFHSSPQRISWNLTYNYRRIRLLKCPPSNKRSKYERKDPSKITWSWIDADSDLFVSRWPWCSIDISSSCIFNGLLRICFILASFGSFVDIRSFDPLIGSSVYMPVSYKP